MRVKNDKFIGFRMAKQDVHLLDKVAARDARTRTGLIKYVLSQYIKQTVPKDVVETWAQEIKDGAQ